MSDNKRCGETIVNNFGSKMIIIKYTDNKNVTVYFPEYNWQTITTYNLFKLGQVKCPYEKRTCGVGYHGIGKYNMFENGNKTKAYITWHHMIQRCYYQGESMIFNPYKSCTVCDEWHNFQNFAKWFEENYYEIDNETMCIDKDILIKGNKIYSPDTCLIVPNRINCLILRNISIRNDLPMGVTFDKVRNKYKAQCKDINCKTKFLGRYNTIEEAFNTYKNYKEALIKKIADMYKNKIPQKLYDALNNYNIDIND